MKSIAKMIIVLSLLCGIAGFGLSYLKISTAVAIEEQILTYVQGPAILSVFVGAENSPIEDRKTFEMEDGREIVVFPSFKKGELVGVAIEDFAGGYGGDVGVVVAIDIANDSILDIGITTLRETPGIGTQCTESSFTKKFKGVEIPPRSVPDGGSIDAISGATISSWAVVNATAKASQTYEILKPAILEAWN